MSALRALVLCASVLPSVVSAEPARQNNSFSDRFSHEDLPPDDREKPQKQAAPTAEPCQATIDENSGIVSVVIADPSRAGQQTNVTVDGFGDDLQLTYSVRFDDKGDVSFDAPIFHESATVAWTGAGDVPCRRSLKFTRFDRTFRGALIWSGDARLALHVVEETGAIGSPAHYVSPERPNRDLGPNSYGFLREFGADGDGLHIQLYSIPSPQNPRDNSLVSFHIAFASRGNPAMSPFCGDNPQASISYHVVLQQDGSAPKLSRLGFGAVRCGTFWPDKDRSFGKGGDMRL